MRKKVRQVKEELPPGAQQENGKDDNDELRNIAARFNRMDATLHKISGDRRLPRMNSSLDNRRNTPMF